jgi:predicted acylesterase/phospholipase RssA
MSGRYVKQLLKPLFGDARLEDQFVPCVIVATDLVTGNVCPLTTGKLDEAVRASSSLPGAWPPVVANGRFLVDGGVINNLPIDVVKAACPKGPVIGVDISGSEDYSVYEPYGQELSGWKVLRQLVWPFGRKPRLPSIMNVISRCCTLSSSSRQQQMLKDDRLLYLPLPVTEYGMFDIRTPEVVAAVEQRGYTFARERLQTWVPAPVNS